MKPIFSAAFLIVLAFASCKKEPSSAPSPPLDETVFKEVQSCSGTRNYDSASLATAIQGQWKHIWMDYGGKRFPDDSLIQARFGADGVYTMWVNTRIMSAGNWQLASQFSGQFRLKMQDTVNAYGGIPGTILLCDDKLYFDNGYHKDYYERVP